MSTKKLGIYSILLFLLTGISLLSGAQITYHYTNKNGLPSDNIYNMVMTSAGVAYLATDNGLCTFNGFSFDVLPTTDRDVLYCFLDTKERIWSINASAELNIHEGKKYIDKELYPQFPIKLKSLVIYDLQYKDKVYLAHGNQLKIFDVNTLESESFDDITEGIIRFMWVWKDEIYLSNWENIYKWKNGKAVLQPNLSSPKDVRRAITVRDTSYLLSVSDISLMSDTGLIPYLDLKVGNQYQDYELLEIDENIYVITSRNVYQLKNRKLYFVQSFPSRVTSYFRSSKGSLWISTLNDGIFNIPTGYEYFERKELESPINAEVTNFLNSKNGMVYGLNNGIVLIDGTQLRYTERIQASVRDIAEYGPFTFIGSDGGFVTYKNGKLEGPKLQSAVKKIKLTEDNLLVATNGYLVSARLDSSAGYTDLKQVYIGRVFTFDAINDEIWMSTMNGFFQLKNGVLKKHLSSLQSVQSSCISIHEIDQTYQYIITGDKKIIVHDKLKDQVVSELKIRPDVKINSSYQVPESVHKVWLSTNEGLFEFVFNETDFSLNIEGSIPLVKDISSNNVLQTSIEGNKLRFMTEDYLYSIDVDKVPLRPKTSTIKLYSAENSGESIALGNTFVLSPSSTSLDLKFYDPTFSISSFEYRLKGSNALWSDMTANSISFNKLKRGKHIVQVRERILTDLNQTPYEITIEQKARLISIPFFQIILAILIVGLFAWIYYIFRRNINREKILEEELASAQANLQLIGLQSQMNPHFLRNCLSSIQSLIHFGKTDQATRFVTHFSTLIEQFLHQAQDNYTSIYEEIPMLDNFIELEKLRFSDQFHFHKLVDEDVPLHLEIPAMFLQPLLENAVEHGLFPSPKREKNLWLIMSFNDDTLKIQIVDDGVGISLDELNKSDSIALNNIAKRIRMFNQSNEIKIEFHIKNGSSSLGLIHGTEVLIFIKYFNL